MGKSIGSCNFDELIKLRDRIEKLSDSEVDRFMEDCARELAARLLAKVIKRTPVGQYPKSTGKKGGTLRRGWTTQASGSGSEGLNTRGAKEYVETLKIHHYGDTYVIELINPVEYASYVEYGHRKRGGKGWVEGKFMMTISEKEIDGIAPKVIEAKLMKMMGEVFK